MNNWRCSDVCLSPWAVLSDLLNFATNRSITERQTKTIRHLSWLSLCCFLAVMPLFSCLSCCRGWVCVWGTFPSLWHSKSEEAALWWARPDTLFQKPTLAQMLCFFGVITLEVSHPPFYYWFGVCCYKSAEGEEKSQCSFWTPPHPILSHYWNNTEDRENPHKWHPSIIHSIKITVPLVVALFCYPDLVFYIGSLPVLLIHVCFCAVSHRELLRGGGTHCS